MRSLSTVLALLAVSSVPAFAEDEKDGVYTFPESLKRVAKTEIELPNARVSLSGKGSSQGKLAITTIRGGEKCKAAGRIDGDILYIAHESALPSEATPAATPNPEPSASPAAEASEQKAQSISKAELSGCYFDVVLEMHQAVPAGVSVSGVAEIEADAWESPMKVRIHKGTVAFGESGDLDVECESCDVSGDGLRGQLRYQIGMGSVGVTRLTGSVEGASRGDAILRWRHMKAASKVNVHSRAGDVALSFPSSTGLALDLKAPRGEIHTKVSSSHQGVPVQVMAEAGAIRLFNR